MSINNSSCNVLGNKKSHVADFSLFLIIFCYNLVMNYRYANHMSAHLEVYHKIQ